MVALRSVAGCKARLDFLFSFLWGNDGEQQPHERSNYNNINLTSYFGPSLPKQSLNEKMKLHLALFVLPLLLLTGCPYDPKSASDLSKFYENEFGSPQPENVEVLNARFLSDREKGYTWLQLELTESALNSLILTHSFQKTELPPHEFTSTAAHTPEWWHPSPIETFEFYTNPHWGKLSWRYSRAAMAVDRVHGIIFFYCGRGD